MDMLTPDRFISKLRSRGRIEAAQAYLTLKRRVNRGPLWIDHGCIRLPFHGDGDRQEIYYYLDGKTWWNNEISSISPYLGQGGVVVDVGANLGFMSGIFSRLTGPGGRVHSFEPSPVVYGKLLEVIAANNLHERGAIQYGVRETRGFANALLSVIFRVCDVATPCRPGGKDTG